VGLSTRYGHALTLHCAVSTLDGAVRQSMPNEVFRHGPVQDSHRASYQRLSCLRREPCLALPAPAVPGRSVMRVLLDCRMAAWSGVGRYTTELARSLAMRDDIDLVQVHAVGERPPVSACRGVEALPAAAHPFSVRGALEFGGIVRRAGPDLVHCPHFPTPVPATHPLVVTLHDLTPLVASAAMPSSIKRAVYLAWNARAVLVADRVLADSRYAASRIGRVFPEAVRKIRVVPLSAEGFASGPVGRIPGGLVPTGAPYLLTMGNTKPHKDLPTLLRAFAGVAEVRSDLHLLLVGADAPGFVASVLHGDEVAGRVRFTGRVGDDVLRALYRDAVAFAFPSRHEGFGLPLLEAMAFGVPVVCSDAASLPEVVGDAASMFPAGDEAALSEALSRVLADRSVREWLSRSGLKRAAQFTWERTTAGTVAAYREALAASRALNRHDTRGRA
jgi:glycosyltransferase involved in cell wall biosynthesis